MILLCFQIFTGNVDKETVVKQKIAACPTAKVVRVYPVAYQVWKQLRVEFFGVRQGELMQNPTVLLISVSKFFFLAFSSQNVA